jgi:hypothetical protein
MPSTTPLRPAKRSQMSCRIPDDRDSGCLPERLDVLKRYRTPPTSSHDELIALIVDRWIKAYSSIEA